MRSRSQVSGIRIWTYLFGGHSSTNYRDHEEMGLSREAGLGVVPEMVIPGGGGGNAEWYSGEPNAKAAGGSRDFVGDSRGQDAVVGDPRVDSKDAEWDRVRVSGGVRRSSRMRTVVAQEGWWLKVRSGGLGTGAEQGVAGEDCKEASSREEGREQVR